MSADEPGPGSGSSSGHGNAHGNGPGNGLSESVDRLSRLAVAVQPLEATLQHVADLAVAAVPGAAGAGVTTRDAGRPVTTAATGDVVREVDQLQYDADEGPCLHAFANARTVVSEEVGDDDRYPTFGPKAAQAGVHAVLAVPLQVGDECTGVLNLYGTSPGPFSATSVEIAQLFSRPAAVALENARLAVESRALVDQLEKAMRSRAVIDQAIGVLVAQRHCSPEEALNGLRAASQRANVRVSELARRIVDSAAAP